MSRVAEDAGPCSQLVRLARQNVEGAVALGREVVRAKERPLVQGLLGVLELGAARVGLIRAGEEVVGRATLVLLPGAEVVHFDLEARLVRSLPLLLCVESSYVARESFLAQICVLVLRFRPLLVAFALVRHREVLVEAVGVWAQ